MLAKNLTKVVAKTAESNSGQPRVLYSFPFRIGTGGICSTAWYQVDGAARAGAQMTVLCGSLGRPFAPEIKIRPTLSRGRIRLPLRFLGRMGACRLHDWMTAQWLERYSAEIDLIHGWPLASLRTIQTAKRLGIPFLLERPNAHTTYAYEATAAECKLVETGLPHGHDHDFNQKALDRELREYDEADLLLCPSDFVAHTFRDRGFKDERLIRHQYGFDSNLFGPGTQDATQDRGLVMLYVGSCEPRKGLHYALKAWLDSEAHHRGSFLVCGAFIPGYAEKLQGMLNHPSIKILGQRTDIGELMRKSDLFVLPSVEEGSALVTYEAKGSGCVLVVSDGAGAICQHLADAMVHRMRDVEALTDQISTLDRDRALLAQLRTKSIESYNSLTWETAGVRLAHIYSTVTEVNSFSTP